MAGNLKKVFLLLLAVFLVQTTLQEVNAYHGRQVFYDDPYYYGRSNYYSSPSYYTHHQYHYLMYQDRYGRYNRYAYYYPPPRYYRYNMPYGRCKYPGDICIN